MEDNIMNNFDNLFETDAHKQSNAHNEQTIKGLIYDGLFNDLRYPVTNELLDQIAEKAKAQAKATKEPVYPYNKYKAAGGALTPSNIEYYITNYAGMMIGNWDIQSIINKQPLYVKARIWEAAINQDDAVYKHYCDNADAVPDDVIEFWAK